MLRDNHRKVLDYRERKEKCEREANELRHRALTAEEGIARLQADLETGNRILEDLMLKFEHARSAALVRIDSIVPGTPASVPEDPIFPDPLTFTLVAAAASLAVGFAWAVARAQRDDIIRQLDDVERCTGLEILAVLPRTVSKNRRDLARAPEYDSLGGFAEAAVALRSELDSPRFNAVSRRVLVLSTQPGAGKTSTATALAIASAQVKRRTLLVDFDLRRPQQARIWKLSLTPERSFSHALQRAVQSSLPDFSLLVNQTPVKGLDVIASLPPNDIHPASIFGSSAIKEFFVWARTHYDRIVIDAPPWGIVGDTVRLATMADTVLMMCRLGVTHYGQIISCTNQLTDAGSRVSGIVVNGAARSDESKFIPGRHHIENAEGLDRVDLLDQLRCFADEE